ncbi:hypothetical protein [Rubrobacter aplysinae]|uniref:hypothetical protein n=1 Tax=Rubrobacter aplysinae TaxID=909625 RepID=UPI00064B832A|nr:hypothetical protein [Rubrobacter aplysinae]
MADREEQRRKTDTTGRNATPGRNSGASGRLARQISDEVESRIRAGAGEHSSQSSKQGPKQGSGSSSGRDDGRQSRSGSGESRAEDELVRQVGDEMEQRLRSGRLGEIEAEAEEARRDIQVHHRLIYGSAVFFAIVLMWYGLEEIIPEIPVINTGPGAVIVGAIILVLSGSFFRSLFGVYLPTK